MKIIQIAVSPETELSQEYVYGLSDEGKLYYVKDDKWKLYISSSDIIHEC